MRAALVTVVRRHWFAAALGLAALSLTAMLFTLTAENPYRDRLRFVSNALSFGVIVAMIPFGGLHEARLGEVATVMLGALFNGVVWFAVGYALQSATRAMRRRYGASSSQHVT